MLQNYTEILVPLLLDIFVEVAPQKTKNQRSSKPFYYLKKNLFAF